MAKITLSVQQIIDLNLWDKVCEFKNWSPYILNEGKISNDTMVEFDSAFKKELPPIIYDIGYEFERKDYEYTVVSRFKDENYVNEHFMYVVGMRKFGQEQIDYIIMESSQIK